MCMLSHEHMFTPVGGVQGILVRLRGRLSERGLVIAFGIYSGDTDA